MVNEASDDPIMSLYCKVVLKLWPFPHIKFDYFKLMELYREYIPELHFGD